MEGTMIAKELHLIGWNLLRLGFYMLSYDGALQRQTRQAAAGGVIRDDNGNWVSGVAVNLGHCSVVMAEAWGVWYVLRLAWDCGIRKAILTLDNLLVIKLISNGSSTINMTSSWFRTLEKC